MLVMNMLGKSRLNRPPLKNGGIRLTDAIRGSPESLLFFHRVLLRSIFVLTANILRTVEPGLVSFSLM